MALMSLMNYLVPASGNCSGYAVNNPADGFIFDPAKISAETGQTFIPSGVIVDGYGAAGLALMKIMPMGLNYQFPADGIVAIPFPSVDGIRFEFTDAGAHKFIFVDYPVIPYTI